MKGARHDYSHSPGSPLSLPGTSACIVLKARHSARPGLAPYPGHLLYLRIKPRVTQRLIPVQRQPDVLNRRTIELRSEQRPIGGLPKRKFTRR